MSKDTTCQTHQSRSTSVSVACVGGKCSCTTSSRSTSLHCTAALHFPPPHCLPEQGHALPCHARRIPPIIADLSYHSRAITRWHVPGALHFTSFHIPEHVHTLPPRPTDSTKMAQHVAGNSWHAHAHIALRRQNVLKGW